MNILQVSQFRNLILVELLLQNCVEEEPKKSQKCKLVTPVYDCLRPYKYPSGGQKTLDNLKAKMSKGPKRMRLKKTDRMEMIQDTIKLEYERTDALVTYLKVSLIRLFLNVCMLNSFTGVYISTKVRKESRV